MNKKTWNQTKKRTSNHEEQTQAQKRGTKAKIRTIFEHVKIARYKK